MQKISQIHINPARKQFVILDRDGTVIEECHYLSSPGQVRLLPGAAAGLRCMTRLGLGLIIVTNQSGLGRGLFNLAQLEKIHERVQVLLEKEDVFLDGIYFCPHIPEDNCDCRKPRTGLVTQAARDLFFEPGESFVIGDKSCDIEMGVAIGATSILVRTGYGSKTAKEINCASLRIVEDLNEAAREIESILTKEDNFLILQGEKEEKEN